jgi:hypothetical protein
MGSQPSDPHQYDEALAAAAARRWASDAQGRAIYQPYGPGLAGFIVDAAREPTLRAADRRYDALSKRLQPYAFVIALPMIRAFRYWLDSRPIFAFAFVAGSFAAIVLANAMLRWMLIRRVLAGLPRTAPSDPRAAARRRSAGLIALALIGGIRLVLWLYDARITATTTDRPLTEFYPDLSQNLLWAVAAGLLIWLLVATWDKLLPKLGTNRMMISLVVLGAVEVALVLHAGATFFSPRAQVAFNADKLWCGRTHLWSDIAQLSLLDDRGGSEYARIALADGRGTVERCEITGLHTHYQAVYDAMHTAWEAAGAKPATATVERLITLPRENAPHP